MKNESARPFGGGFIFRGGAKRQQEEELDWFRSHDSFAGLPNMNVLEQDYARLEGRSGWTVVLIHINGFIRLNSIFGLDLGGDTIRRLCPILDEFAGGQGGRAYRISLGRLVVLAPTPDKDGFFRGLEDTLDRMEQVQVVDGSTVYSYHYSFAYGAYCLADDPQEFRDLGTLLSFVEIAARRERNDHKSGGAQFDLQSRPVWARRDTLLPEVQTAWKNEEFEPCYQPVYDLKSNKPVGAELLIRWRHPQRGLIPPADFLPLMEAEGMIMDLDLYMLESACKKIKRWMDEGLLTIPLSINICRRNIHRPDFLPRLIEIITTYEIPPVLIELELSESALLFEKSDWFLYLVEQLHRVGFSLTMDDCAASEMSSVNLLRELPLDAVKINRRFLERVGESRRDRVFVTNILRMAGELGVRTIAAGIETQEQAAAWMELGCSLGQGFHLSHPLFNDAFEKLIF